MGADYERQEKNMQNNAK